MKECTKYKDNPHSFLNIRSIRFRTWFYFFAMTIIIISVLLVMQFAFFMSYYRSARGNEVEGLSKNIVNDYKIRKDNIEFQNKINNSASVSGVTIIFFQSNFNVQDNKVTVDDESIKAIFSSVDLFGDDGVITDDDNRALKDSGLLDETYFLLLSEKDEFSYNRVFNKQNYLIHGVKTQDEIDPTIGERGDVYLLMATPLGIDNYTITALQKQTIITTIICILISVLLSWLVSSRIAGPITDFSKTAKKLGTGDYTVRFLGNGVSEIEDLATTLNYATEEMAKTEQFRKDLLANVSHDLRTPLTMVKAYAEMIRDISGADAAKRTAHSQVIIDEADRLTNLVNDIQNLSKLQSGTDEIRKAEVDLSVMTKMVLERFDIYSSQQGYKFVQNIDDGCVVLADEVKIEQVLYNLIGNALNYTGQDKTISVYVRNDFDMVYFGVRDTGKGIAPEDIDNVWERYYRANQTKRTHVGTGLGLSIVKNILIEHEAQYGIDSVVGAGSTFWFSMPKINNIVD